MFKNFGFIKDANKSCKIVTKIETLKKKFTTFILFKPEVQSIRNSLSFSNLRIVKNKAIKNDRGINLVKIFGMFKSE